MAVNVKLPPLAEALERLDRLMANAFDDHSEPMADWLAVRFELRRLQKRENDDRNKNSVV